MAVDLLSGLNIRLPRNAERFLGRGGGVLLFALSDILNIFGVEHKGKSRWKEYRDLARATSLTTWSAFGDSMT